MEVFSLNKFSAQAQLNVHNISDPRTKCVFEHYRELEVIILNDFHELQKVLDIVPERKDTFPIFVFSHEKYYQKVVKDIQKPESINKRSVAEALVFLINRSFLFLAFYFNKGIRTYLLNNLDFVRALVKTIITLIFVNCKRSFIKLSLEDMKTVSLITILFVFRHILGIQSDSQISALLKQLQIDFDVTTFNRLKSYVQSSHKYKSLIHLIAELQGWNKFAIESLLLNISRILGPELSYLFFTVLNVEDPVLEFAFKMAYTYDLYKSGRIQNVSILNRITKLEFSRFIKQLEKVSKMLHFGYC